MAVDWKIVKKIVDAYCEAHPELSKAAVAKSFRRVKSEAKQDALNAK